MKSLKILFILVFASTFSLYAQDSNLLWQQVYHEGSTSLKKIFQTSDLGYMMGGQFTNITGGGGWGMIVTKLNAQGEITWFKGIGDNIHLADILSTTDGGYIVGGDVAINSNYVTSFYIYKLDENGNHQWHKTIGGSSHDAIYSLKQTNDGGYILGGFSRSDISGDKTENSRGGADYWVVKVNSSGTIEWQKTIGGSGTDILTSISQTSDNGYIVAGYSDSDISGEKIEMSRGGLDYWILKLDDLGNIEWQRTIGGSSDDTLRDMKITSDGGYILTGSSKSNISGEKTEPAEGGYEDYWIVKLGSIGEIEWQNTIGGTGKDISTTIIQTSDNGYLVGGYSDSNIGGKKNENSQGQDDYWIVKLNGNGNIEWQNNIGGNKKDRLSSVSEDADGSFILGGTSFSGISGDKTIGEEDIYGYYWVIRHSAVLSVHDFEKKNKVLAFPNPVQSILNIESTENFIEIVRIYDINGRLINEFKNIENPVSIDLSHLERGIYFAEISNSQNVTMKKIIKE